MIKPEVEIPSIEGGRWLMVRWWLISFVVVSLPFLAVFRRF